MRISIDTLRAHRACSEQRDLFFKLFGTEEIEVTVALCVKHAGDFDWYWAAEKLLPLEQLEEYDKQIIAFREKRRAAEAVFQKERDAKIASIQAEPYSDVHIALAEQYWIEFKAKSDPLWVTFDIECATLFGQMAEKL